MTVPHLEPWQWALAAFAAFCVGVSKTGVAGVGIVSVALFALVLPAKSAVGIALLVLICADIVAITAYPREQVRWDIWRGVFPWAILGVVAGAFALRYLTDASAVRRVIGAILLLIVGLQVLVRVRRDSTLPTDLPPVLGCPASGCPPAPPAVRQSASEVTTTTALAGVTTGVATMIANAAGPVMILYLLPRKLPKQTFVATTAWFFFALNLLKVPFSVGAGMMDAGSPVVAACLIPAAVGGGVFGKWLLPRIEQSVFETSALVLTALASARLLMG